MNYRVRILALAAVVVVLLASAAFAENFTFVHISDTHLTGAGSNVATLTSIAKEINAMKPKPAFAVISGDLTETGLARDWEKFAETAKAFEIPVYKALGNHEVKWSHLGKNALEQYVDQQTQYSFDCGGLHFVALDSTVWLQHHGQIDKHSIEWLTRDLAKAGNQTPSVLFYHHCPGYQPNESELLRAIRPYNVRLILVGHGHVYKVWKRNGLEFQECQAAKNNGAYRILEVTDTHINSSRKLVGQEATPEGTVALARPRNPINLIEPRFNDKIEGSIHIRAAISGPTADRKIEYSIGGQTGSLEAGAGGVYETDVDFDGACGWYTLYVKMTDPDGMEWSDSVPVQINGDAREAWQVAVSGGVQRGVAAANGELYFGTLSGDVYCLDARTGSQIWRDNFGSEILSEVAVAGDLACFGTTAGRVFGVDAATGKARWQFDSGGAVVGSAAIHDGKVLIGAGGPAFYALDAKSGKMIWKLDMNRYTQVVPVVLNGSVMYGAWDTNFYALDVNTGQIKWKTSIGPSFYFSTANSDPVTDGKHIGVNVTPHQSGDADIYCLDAESGKIVWSKRNPGRSDCGFNSPGSEGNLFYNVSGNGQIYCMSFEDGKQLWESNIGSGTTSGKPVAADGKVYVAGRNGMLVCLDGVDGKVQWKYSVGDGFLFGGSTVWEDLVIVPSMEGTVTAVRR
ncbi:MAG: PQQ-binding-like beta-propeller repeat protein [Armatimonadota bacterium]|jgi:outer membrane protein assembly factor BamB